MTRYGIICVAMLLLAGQAGAETYRCRDAEGNIVFTDDPTAYRAGCEAVKLEDLPPVPADPAARFETSPSAAPRPERGDEDETFAFYRRQASALVAEFKTAQQGSLHSNLVREKIAARRELGTIRLRKSQLIEQLATAQLDEQQKEEIRNMLAAITEAE